MIRARLTATVLAGALLLGGGVATPFALAEGGASTSSTNSAYAVNTTDNSSVFKFAFAIRSVANGVVDQTNAAVAYSSCTSCRTIAIAIEIIFVIGNASTFTPKNYAIAINDRCTLCVTFASAYQFVIGEPGPVTFTHEGWKTIRDIKQAIRDLADQNLPPDQLQAQLSDLITRLQAVLANDVVPVHDEGDNQQGPGPNEQSTNQSTRTQPATTGTTPTATATAGSTTVGTPTGTTGTTGLTGTTGTTTSTTPTTNTTTTTTTTTGATTAATATSATPTATVP